jgi:hypothetical protein
MSKQQQIGSQYKFPTENSYLVSKIHLHAKLKINIDGMCFVFKIQGNLARGG